MPAAKRSTKAEQAEATTSALLDIAMQKFAAVGYAASNLEEIVHEAGLTRGALYHHFGSKHGLFLAVVEHLQRDIAQRIERATTPDADHWTQLVMGCHAFLAACTDPIVQQIILVDAPAVLGWDTWRKLDAEHGGRLLYAALRALIDEGTLKPLPLAPVTHLLSGAMNEAALWIAQAHDPQQALQAANTALDALLVGLRQDPRQP